MKPLTDELDCGETGEVGNGVVFANHKQVDLKLLVLVSMATLVSYFALLYGCSACINFAKDNEIGQVIRVGDMAYIWCMHVIATRYRYRLSSLTVKLVFRIAE